jgi:hypothetical protein
MKIPNACMVVKQLIYLDRPGLPGIQFVETWGIGAAVVSANKH